MADIFKGKAFDVEHALSMYATSYVTMPAFGIYEDEIVARYIDQIRLCHIYIIGLTPKVDFIGAKQEAQHFVTSFEVGSQFCDLRWKLPKGAGLKGNNEEGWYVEDEDGDKIFPSTISIGKRLSSEHGPIGFKVLYIGQAYGDSGSRNALDRLKKHETPQKIAVKGIPEGYSLTILMLAIEPANGLITMFNPWAEDKNQGPDRIRNGLEKLFGTSEAERTTLYEASLIRYFKPHFNKEFKNSFPSTNMKILVDCYDKDFSAVIAEICIDELPYQLFSDEVETKAYHIAKHDLHTDERRRVFFA